jgi:hypothetical protein
MPRIYGAGSIVVRTGMESSICMYDDVGVGRDEGAI